MLANIDNPKACYIIPAKIYSSLINSFAETCQVNYIWLWL